MIKAIGKITLKCSNHCLISCNMYQIFLNKHNRTFKLILFKSNNTSAASGVISTKLRGGPLQTFCKQIVIVIIKASW